MLELSGLRKTSKHQAGSHGAQLAHPSVREGGLKVSASFPRFYVFEPVWSRVCRLDERPVSRVGTLDYMTPEVLQCPYQSVPGENKAKAHLEYDASVDTWAVGVLTYEILCGQAPFQSSDKQEKKRLILQAQVKYPDRLTADAKDFIQKTLVKEASGRTSISDLLQHPLILSYCPEGEPELAPSPRALEPTTSSPTAFAAAAAAPERRSEMKNSTSSASLASQTSVGIATQASGPVAGFQNIESAASASPTALSVPSASAFRDLSLQQQQSPKRGTAGAGPISPSKVPSNLSRSSKAPVSPSSVLVPPASSTPLLWRACLGSCGCAPGYEAPSDAGKRRAQGSIVVSATGRPK